MDGLGVIFAGGGTGGHLFPGLAVLEALRERLGGAPAHVFLCSDRPLDGEILSREGVRFEAIAARPFVVSARGLWALSRTWGSCVRAGRGAIRRLRSESGRVVVVSMGGFVSPAIVQAGRAERAPRLLVNLDAVPGRANRWSASRVHRVLSVMGAGGFEAIPPIVRTSAVFRGSMRDARRALGLDPDMPTLLVTGGSQGAGSLDFVMRALASGALGVALPPTLQVVHQARPENLDDVRGAYADAGVRAMVTTFIERIGEAWASADVAIARAGAGNVAEVWANRVPTIFLPYPGHADEHQRRNAQPLADAGGAIIITDAASSDATARAVGGAIGPLLTDASVRARMRDALGALGSADGAARVAGAIIDLAGA